MDRQRVAATAESYGIRGRGMLRTAVELLGIAAVLLGAYNMLIAPVSVAPAVFVVYRAVAFDLLTISSSVYADIALIAIGVVVAWFV